MTQLLKGDKGASDDSLYLKPVAIGEAYMIACVLIRRLHIDAEIFVLKGKKARLKYGTIRSVAHKTYELRLNSCGMNVGTLLHEMAHVAANGEMIEDHGEKFRGQLVKLISEYKKLKG